MFWIWIDQKGLQTHKKKFKAIGKNVETYIDLPPYLTMKSFYFPSPAHKSWKIYKKTCYYYDAK